MTRWEWSNRVLSASGPESPTVRFVLVVLLSDYNESKGYAWPSVTRLSGKTGFCEKTVRAALVESETVGWLRRDAVLGHVTHYYPTVPEDRALKLTPVRPTDPGRQLRAMGSVAVTDDLRRDLSSEASRRKEKPPACPQCTAPMKEERSRRTKDPMFWGCSLFRATGCKGKLEFGEEGPAKPAGPSRAERDAGQRRRDREAALADRAVGPSPLTDAAAMAARLVGAPALRGVAAS